MSTPPIAILDSNIYIAHWVYNRYHDQMDWVRRRFLIRQSSVVLHELRRGSLTRDASDRVDLLRHISPQILSPTGEDWWQGGEVLAQIQKKEKWGRDRIRILQNDLLIALTCRRHGAVLITGNRKDFETIRRYCTFQFLCWTPKLIP